MTPAFLLLPLLLLLYGNRVTLLESPSCEKARCQEDGGKKEEEEEQEEEDGGVALKHECE